MALHWPTFFTRLGSAIVFAIVMMGGLLWNEFAFLALVALIQVLCFREYFTLIRKIFPNSGWPSWLPITIQVGSLYWLTLVFLSKQNHLLYPAFMFFPVTIILISMVSKRNIMGTVFQSLTSIFYILLPMALLIVLRNQISMVIPIALVLMLWMNDTMAYLVGSFIGRTPLTQISPKKTWEGTLGGVLLTMVGAGIWGYYSPYYHMYDWVIIAMLVCIAGTAGDLFESKLKRLAGVKDSGAIMPGHGGALDRFDSLLVATPFVFGYAYVFMPPIPVVIF